MMKAIRYYLYLILPLMSWQYANTQWSTNPTVNTPICPDPIFQANPHSVSDGAGGAIVTWEDYRNGHNSDIYAQRINASGFVQWTTDGVPISTDSNDQTSPTIVGDDAGGAIIAWEDKRSGTNYDIYAQRIDA